MPEIEDNDAIELPKVDELTTLKARADMLGIAYHPSIGVDKLRGKIDAKLNNLPDPEEGIGGAIKLEKADQAAVGETPLQRRIRVKKEANELVRIRVTCMNPAKKEWDGEIFTTGNANIGTFKKYVPFNNEEGWHVPRIILEMMKQRQCQIFTTVKTSKNGIAVRKGKQIKEFAIEILDPLTPKELKELAQRQLMASGEAA